MRKIGILGGTFDPIHAGHIDIGSASEAALGLTRLFVIPSNVPPHRPETAASGFHRFAMVALTVATRPRWQASDLELRETAPSYTSTTLTRFHERLPISLPGGTTRRFWTSRISLSCRGPAARSTTFRTDNLLSPPEWCGRRSPRRRRR
jgi:nicotinate (nicotinamide) nucleotide adenylyltransferase